MMARYFGNKLPPAYNIRTNLNFSSTDGLRGAVQSKLEQITFKETPAFDGLPLSEIIKFIDERSRNLDPASEGINFIISNSLDAAPPTSATMIDPNTGLPIQPTVIEPIDIRNTIVRLPSLRNLQLKDLLDAVCKVADQPIQYTVEQYGVIFSRNPSDLANPLVREAFRTSDSEVPQVRTFRIDKETILAGLESAFGISLSDQWGGGSGVGGGVGRGGGGGGGGRGSDRSKQARDIQDSLKRVFSQLGINMNAMNKAIVYNELTGILLVRATVADLKIAEAAIETLGGTKIEQSRPVGSGNTGSSTSDASTEEFKGTTHLPITREARANLVRSLQSEAEKLEGKVKSADQALAKYRVENKSDSLEERQNIEMQSLIQARTDLSRAQSEAAVAQTNAVQVTRWEQNGVPLENIPQIAEDISIKELQRQFAFERSKLEGLLTKYKEKWPQVQESRALVADLTRSIDERAKQIAASIKRKAELLKRSEETLEDQVRQKEEKVMELSNQRIEYDSLSRDLQSKRDLLNKVLEKKKETEIRRITN